MATKKPSATQLRVLAALAEDAAQMKPETRAGGYMTGSYYILRIAERPLTVRGATVDALKALGYIDVVATGMRGGHFYHITIAGRTALAGSSESEAQ